MVRVTVCHLRLALYTMNLSTKFNVSNSAHYDDTKGDTKCRKLDGLGLLALFSAGSSLSYYLAPFVLNVITFWPFILLFVVFPRLCSRPSTIRHVHYPSHFFVCATIYGE